MKEPDSENYEVTSGSGYDYERDKPIAEAMLRRLCLGAEIVGVFWDGFPGITKLIIDDNRFVEAKKLLQYAAYVKHRPAYESMLMIEDKWTILATVPEASAEQEQAIAEVLPEHANDQQLTKLAALHRDPIVEVRLGISVGHLILVFDSGQCFFVNGDHEMYESWEITAMSPPENKWLLVNTTGGNIAIWTPDDFDPNFDAEWQRPEE